MSVTELRCSSCLAPIDPTRGETQRCVYCGASLVIGLVGTLRLEACGPNKIAVIKVLFDHTGLGLKECKDIAESAPCVLAEGQDAEYIDRLRAALIAVGAHTSSTRPEPPPPPAQVGSVAPNVVLEHCGPNKISVIKVLRDYLHLGLKEAKDMAEGTPCVIAEGWDPARASKLRSDLVAAGARVR